MLLPKEKSGGGSGDQNASYVEPKSLTLPRYTTLILGATIIGICILGVIYFLKRNNYLMLFGLFLLFIPFFLGISLLVYDRCPPYLTGIYGTLPICRYTSPTHYGFPAI